MVGGTLTQQIESSAVSSRDAMRRLLKRIPHARPATAPGTPLERLPTDGEPPHLKDAEVVEDATVRARRVPGGPVAGFAAFLDGTQHSEVVAWIGAAPVVHGRVAAAVRIRRDRRLATWREPTTRQRVYAPLPYTPWGELEAAFPGSALVDTAVPDETGAIPEPHPLVLLERARHAVSRDREIVERQLAEAWCRSESAPVFIDGGLAASEIVASAECAVGVIKSHRTLYVQGAALDVVLGLAAGERSSVIRIAPRDRASVYSWYLRLRDAGGHDALWGLVRVEVAANGAPTERADLVSRWVLAETRPLSAPDTRWDKMAYGVRNAEEFLRAIM